MTQCAYFKLIYCDLNAYTYKLNTDNVLVPEAIHSENWTDDPATGAKVKSETNTYFENVSATII